MDAHQDESLSSEGRVGAPGWASGERPPFRWRRRHTLIAVLAVLVAAVAVASLVSIPYYAITPGQATSVEQLIGLPKGRVHAHKGQFLLVDVLLTPLRAIEWPYFELDPNAQIVTAGALLGTANAAQYQIQGQLDMSNAQRAATVVALRRLGYKVSVHNAGALVYGIQPSSPAAQALGVGDIITAIDGTTVATFDSLARDLSRYRPGETITLRLLTWPKRSTDTVKVRLSAWRVKGKGQNAQYVCPVYGTGTRLPLYHPPATKGSAGSGPEACVGVSLEQSYRVGKLPFRIDLSSEGIIGPSAGLAFTLGLIQRLDPYDLTGGHKVAATGTMDIAGGVGDVGGVAEKTIAVRDAGAKVFFVPPQEYKVALAHAGNSLKVYAVSTVSQALHILVTRYGGKLPAAAPAN